MNHDAFSADPLLRDRAAAPGSASNDPHSADDSSRARASDSGATRAGRRGPRRASGWEPGRSSARSTTRQAGDTLLAW